MTISYSINRKLRTNDPPTVEEAAIVKKALTGSLGKLQTLDTKIAILQGQLKDLSLQQEQLSGFVEGHGKLLSPARRLLPEILQEIFYHCLPATHNAVMGIEDAPLLLGRVCSQWRQIAYSAPQLWNTIHIIATPSSTPSARRIDGARRQAISAWLSRSGVLPLSISMCATGFNASRRPRNPINDQIQPYLGLLTLHMHRWRSIHFTMHYFDWTQFFKTYGASDLPLLEILHLEGDLQRRRDHDTLDIATPSRKNGVLQAPRLCALSLPSYFPRLLELSIRWTALKGLDLSTRGLAPEDINKALALCTNLEVCSIAVITPDYHNLVMQPHSIAEVALPKLRTLEIKSRSNRNENTFQLFEKLSTPALRHLSYERSIYMWPHSPTPGDTEFDRLSSSLALFLRRLIGPLEELDLWIGSENTLKDILPLVPDLKRLSLRGTGIPRASDSWGTSTSLLDDRVLAFFIPGRNEDPASSTSSDSDSGDDNHNEDSGFLLSPFFCPKLEVFHCGSTLFSNARVLEFLRARSIDYKKHNVTHLKRASISFSLRLPRKPDSLDDTNIRDQISALGKETGMMVDLQYPSTPSPPMIPPYNSYSAFNGLNCTSTSDMGRFLYSGFWETPRM